MGISCGPGLTTHLPHDVNVSVAVIDADAECSVGHSCGACAMPGRDGLASRYHFLHIGFTRQTDQAGRFGIRRARVAWCGLSGRSCVGPNRRQCNQLRTHRAAVCRTRNRERWPAPMPVPVHVPVPQPPVNLPVPKPRTEMPKPAAQAPRPRPPVNLTPAEPPAHPPAPEPAQSPWMPPGLPLEGMPWMPPGGAPNGDPAHRGPGGGGHMGGGGHGGGGGHK